jgi:hypothetical protein
MSGQTPVYSERVYSSRQGNRAGQRARWKRSTGISPGWMLASLAGLGLAAWMTWHFRPDLVPYLKMERM